MVLGSDLNLYFLGEVLLTSEQSEQDTNRGVQIRADAIYIYIYITLARNMDQSDHSIGVDYLSIFHPNNPLLVLGMLVECVTTDISSSN